MKITFTKEYIETVRSWSTLKLKATIDAQKDDIAYHEEQIEKMTEELEQYKAGMESSRDSLRLYEEILKEKEEKPHWSEYRGL